MTMLSRGLLGLVAVALVASACRKATAPKPGASAAARPSASTRATPSASATAPAAPPSPATNGASENDEPTDDFELSEEAQALFQKEFSAARQASAQKRYDDALAHYSKALSTGKNDAVCLGERGYVRFLQHDLAGAAVDLEHAAGAGADDEVHGQVWYNLGLVSSAQGRTEAARAAFARSLALRANRVVEAKLGGASRCTSSIYREHAAEEAVSVHASWLKTHAALGIPGVPKNEQEARKMVCSADGYGEHGQMSSDCRDADFFTVSCCGGLGRFMLQMMSVVPRPDGRVFAIHHGSRGGWPRGCQGVPEPELSVYGKVVLVATKGRQLESNGDYQAPDAEGSDRDPPCRLTPNIGDYAVYDLDSGKRLLLVVSYQPLAPKLGINAAGTELTLSGHGCSEKIALK